jgi:hypothetical protein
MATCLDKILCENAFGCDITILDGEGNPVNPLNLNNGDTVIFVLGEKPGYRFIAWVDEEGLPYYYESLGDNRYRINAINCSKQYIAKYCAIQYVVNVTSDDTTCFDPYTIQTHYGAIVPIQASDTLKCRFLYWTKDGEVYSENNSFEYVVTGNATFVANYDNIKYRITAKPDKMNRGDCAGSGVFDLNTSVTISATANNGYFFEQWDDGITEQTRTVTVRGNKTYVAMFGVQENVVTVPMVSGGTAIGGGTYRTGNVVSLQALPQTGWKFDYWMVGNERRTEPTISFVADGNVTAIPYFTQGQYSVSFKASPSGKGYFTPSTSASYSYGETFEITANPSIGYDFAGWADGFSGAKRTITVYGDAEYVAFFKQEENRIMLSVDLPDNSYECTLYVGYQPVGVRDSHTISTSVVAGTRVNLAPIIPDGKRLVSVTDGNGNIVWAPTGNDRVSTFIPYTVGNEDTELTLNFTSVVYSVTVTAMPLNEDTSGNIELTVSIGSIYDVFSPTFSTPSMNYDGVAYGTTARLTAPSFVGTLAFSYWYTDNGSFTTPTMYVTVDKKLKCVAVYE